MSREADSIKFKDLIEGNWKFILLSSYCIDYEWLIGQFDGISPDTDINIIEHYEKITERAGIQSSTAKSLTKPRKINLIHPPFPKFPNYGVMHCKIMILASDQFMRIVISSANLMNYDYEEIQNIVFVQDLPKLKEATLTATSASFLIDCQFYLAMNRLLDLLGVFNENKLIMPMDLMQKYDWTGVKAKLVYSVPGYLSSHDANASGIAMLNRIVKEQFNQESLLDNVTIEYQGSSIGAIKREWLKEFGLAATGKLFSFNSTSKKRPFSTAEYEIESKLIDLTDENDENDENVNSTKPVEFKVIFPSLKTVQNSLVGPQGFGTLFCKQKDFDSPECPPGIFYDCVTGPSENRCKYAMHSKIMTVSVSGGKKGAVYVYYGSHNFTASAWGKTAKQGTMLMISNFEVGVLIPKSESGHFSYPYFRPAPEYQSNDVPWDQTEFYQF